MPCDTVLFATEIVPQIHKSDNAEISDIGEVLQLSGCTIPAYVYCVSGFACYSCLLGGMRSFTAAFAPVIVHQVLCSSFPASCALVPFVI
jgi:hypothetical protein